MEDSYKSGVETIDGIKVFISSVGEELSKERGEIIKSITKIDFVIEPVFFEDWVARPEAPIEICLRKVQESDIYVGIFKNYYGNIPTENNIEEISITEMEYREAIRCKKPVLIFIYKDDRNRDEKLKIFINHIDAKHYRNIFSTKEELAEKVIRSIEAEIKKQFKEKKKANNIDDFNSETKVFTNIYNTIININYGLDKDSINDLQNIPRALLDITKTNKYSSKQTNPTVFLPDSIFDKQKIEYVYKPQKALELPTEFINRKRKIDEISTLLSIKDFFYVYGISRSSKTFLISQFLRELNIEKYYWYDFKINQSYEDELFYNDLAKFLFWISKEDLTYKFWEMRKISFSELAARIGIFCKNNEIKYFIFDNVNYIKNVKQLISFIEEIYNESGLLIKFIFISETRDTFDSITGLILNMSKFKLDGFDEEEVKALMYKNNCNIVKITPQSLSQIVSTTQGHPDIINELITEIKKEAKEKESIIVIINNLLSGWQNIQQMKLITNSLQKNLENQLLSDEEKRLFGRLSALTLTFSEDLAEYISKIAPEIKDFGLRFNLLKIKFLDCLSNQKYQIPSLLKKVGNDYLTKNEKNEVYFESARFLMQPKNKILNFDDGVAAIHYFLFAEKIEEALNLGKILLAKLLEKQSDDNTIRYSLSQLDFLLYINITKIDINNYFPLLIIFLAGFKRISNNTKENKIIEKINNLNQSDLIGMNRYLLNYYLIIHYLKKPNKKNEISEFFFSLIEIINTDIIPKDLIILLKTDETIKDLFYLIMTYDLTDLSFIINFIRDCKSSKYNFEQIFSDGELLFLLEELHIEIFKSLKNIKYDKTNDIKYFLEKYEDIKSILKNDINNIESSILYIQGSLILDFENDYNLSLIYFENSRKTYKINLGNNGIFFGKIIIGKADTFYRMKNYNDSIILYKEALKIFEKIETNSILYWHSNIRIAHCLSYLNNFEEAKKYFGITIFIAKKLENNKFGILLETFGDLSTYYINNKDYLKAVKCFSIMISMLTNQEIKDHFQIVLHCLGWLVNTLKGNWDGKVINQNGTKSNEDWVLPHFEFYRNKISLPKKQYSEIHNLYILSEAFNLVGLDKRSIVIYKKILSLESNYENENFIKIVSNYFLFVLYFKKTDYQKDLDYAINYLRLYEKIDFKRLHPHFNEDDLINQVIYQMILPIINRNLNTFKTVEEFERTEKLFTFFISLCEDSPQKYKMKLLALAKSILGWLYTKNILLDQKNYERAKFWLNEGQNTAESINYKFVLINNQIFSDFNLPPEENDLKNYLTKNFSTFCKIIDDWEISKHFIENYWNGFYRIWSDLHRQKYDFDEKSTKIVEILNQTIREFEVDTTNYLEKALLLSIIFIKLDEYCDFNYMEKLKIVLFLLNESSSRFIQYFNTILDYSQKTIKEYIISYVQAKNVNLEIIKKCRVSLKIFGDINSSNFNTDAKRRLEEILKELNDFYGEL